MTVDAKKTIVDCALSMGFEHAVVASLEPMQAEQKFYEEWLAQGYAASMNYLKRDPSGRNQPSLLVPEAYSAILLFANYYTERPEDPGPQYGKVARYAVGEDYHNVLPRKLTELKTRIEEKLNRPILGRYFTDDVNLFEQAFASRHGLGFTGKNSLIIGPKLMGSYHFVAELFTDIPLEADLPYKGTCGNCFRCAEACPTGAIVGEKIVDSNLCISFLTIENKEGIPIELRSKLGNWVFGCDVCQEVCPYNSKAKANIWQEFQPDSGAGHFLDLFEILKIPSQREFMRRFGKSPLSRPKRKGLIRNALVVIGNQRPENGEDALQNFLAIEQNEMLIEHAQWALAQYTS